MNTEQPQESKNKLARDDQRARELALDVTQSFIVQAPAGSGKTELLIQRYLFLLGIADNPEEVLAITFTRKAAAEMRLRVLLSLQRAAAGEAATEAHEQTTLRAAGAVLQRDQLLGWGILANPRRMRIQTLDALNASIARMQPLTSAVATGAAVVDLAEMNSLYRRAAAATLDWLGDRSDEGTATQEVLLHVDNHTSVYIGYLTKMLQTRDQWLPFIGSGKVTARDAERLRQRFEAALCCVVESRLASLQRAFPAERVPELVQLASYAARNLLEGGNTDSPIARLDRVTGLPDSAADAVPMWQGIAELLLTRDGNLRAQVNKSVGFPAGEKRMKPRMSELLEALGRTAEFSQYLHAVRDLPPVRYSDEQWSVLLSLFRLLPVAVAELKRLAAARGVTDYTEIALSAGSALGTAEQPGDIALLLDYQVRHILVDEMQDTSKAQYRMLEALTGGWQDDDQRTLFCVGDPMQSIYRFRNAEVAQFLLARSNGIGAINLKPLTLRKNFRSGEHLVHWFNTVFPVALADQDDAASGAVSYSEAVPVERLAGQGDVQLYPVVGTDAQMEARQSFDVVRKLLVEHPEDEVAILVRGRSHLPILLAMLRDAGVDYQSVDLDNLTDLPEIIDVLALTRAFAHLGDRVAWLALLRSPWLGLTWSDCHALVYADRHSTVWELLGDADRIGRLTGQSQRALRRFVAQLAAFLENDRSLELHRRVEAAWFALGGPGLMQDDNAVANVNHFFDVLAALEVNGSLADVALLEAQLDGERVSTSNAARLQIMTMHKAKGLQFDHVVLHGLGRQPKPRTHAVISWFDLPDAHGAEEKLISAIGRRDDADKDRIHSFIEKTESAKDSHEKARLLYVACTRARKSLHLIGNAKLSKDGTRLLSPVSSTLLSLLWPLVNARFEKAFADNDEPAVVDDAVKFAAPVLRRFTTPWQLPEPEPVPGQRRAADGDDGSYAVDFHWVGLEARLAGTVVHRWLQFAAVGSVTLAADKLAALRSVSKRWLREAGAGEGLLESICERVDAALQAVLEDERGAWLLEGEGAAELALTGSIDGRLHAIVIDRIRIDADGTHWLVDYKTSTHEGGNLEGFLQAESDRYRTQLRKYAQIYAAYSGTQPKCALYFPLLREFVEVGI